MNTLTAIQSRRSVRRFTTQPVSKEDTTILLRAGMAAPSAGNAQPWHFVLIDDKNLLEQIPAINPYATMAATAPLGILVCGALAEEKYPGFWVQDCSAAIQNILLATVDLGLGAVWTGIHPMEDRVTAFQDLCKLPCGIIPLALLVIGYPDAQPNTVDRFNLGKIHHNYW